MVHHIVQCGAWVVQKYKERRCPPLNKKRGICRGNGHSALSEKRAQSDRVRNGAEALGGKRRPYANNFRSNPGAAPWGHKKTICLRSQSVVRTVLVYMKNAYRAEQRDKGEVEPGFVLPPRYILAVYRAGTFLACFFNQTFDGTSLLSLHRRFWL